MGLSSLGRSLKAMLNKSMCFIWVQWNFYLPVFSAYFFHLHLQSHPGLRETAFFSAEHLALEQRVKVLRTLFLNNPLWQACLSNLQPVLTEHGLGFLWQALKWPLLFLHSTKKIQQIRVTNCISLLSLFSPEPNWNSDVLKCSFYCSFKQHQLLILKPWQVSDFYQYLDSPGHQAGLHHNKVKAVMLISFLLQGNWNKYNVLYFPRDWKFSDIEWPKFVINEHILYIKVFSIK